MEEETREKGSGFFPLSLCWGTQADDLAPKPGWLGGGGGGSLMSSAFQGGYPSPDPGSPAGGLGVNLSIQN